jgi:hypothetical protein
MKDGLLIVDVFNDFDHMDGDDHHTALALLPQELEIERILLIGSATEGCVVQTGIDPREAGFKVTIVADACATNDSALAEIALRYAEEVGGMRISDASSRGTVATSSCSPEPDFALDEVGQGTQNERGC